MYICCADLQGEFSYFLVPMNSSGMMKRKNKINFRMHYSDKMSFLSNVKIHGVMVSFVSGIAYRNVTRGTCHGAQ